MTSAAFDVEIIETYYGDDVSAELFESKPRDGCAAHKYPFGVLTFDADAGETVRRFATLDAARDYFDTIE